MINRFFTIILQIRWWLITFEFYFLRKKTNFCNLPNAFLFQACCLNSFSYYEAVRCHTAGFDKWKDIKNIIPDNLVKYFNHKKIQKYKENRISKKEIELLQYKSNLLGITSKEFLVPYFNQKLNKSFQQIEKDTSWFNEYLINQGVIVKPNSGYASLNIVFCTFKDNKLTIIKLFQKKERVSLSLKDIPSINKIKDFLIKYSFFENNDEDIIFQPYIKNKLFSSEIFPSVVIRVITEKKRNNISIMESWIEIPLNKSQILYINRDGLTLPTISSSYNEEKVNYFKDFYNNDNTHFEKCINASLIMHEKFRKLEMIAWDWIPTENHPKLLEGNHNFGLFIPQLFDKISKKDNNLSS